MRSLARYLLVGLFLGISLSFFIGATADAQIGGEKCCVKGPGDCYQKLDYDEVPSCAGGYSIQHESCLRIDTCNQQPTANINCCVCPQSPTNFGEGVCFAPSSKNAPCGIGTSGCTQRAEVCTEISECLEWLAPATAEDDYEPNIVFFIPQFTIPGSAAFNKGVPVQVTGETLGEYIVALYVFFVGVAGILAIVFIMYGGVRYVVSMGNQQKTSQAKDTITSALMGLLIALGSYIILLTINPNLVAFNGLKVDSQFPIVQQEIREGTTKTSTFNWRGNTDEFDKCLTEEAANNSIDRDWLKALMLVESGGDPNAKSSAGAYGLIQLLPSTANDILPGVTAQQLLNPAINIQIAAKYYNKLLITTCPTSATYRSGKQVKCDPSATKCTRGDHKYANAAYNGGVGANCSSITCTGLTWWECEANEGYAETRAYVGKVQAAYEKIILSKQDPGGHPDFVWNDTAGLSCAELRSQ